MKNLSIIVLLLFVYIYFSRCGLIEDFIIDEFTSVSDTIIFKGTRYLPIKLSIDQDNRASERDLLTSNDNNDFSFTIIGLDEATKHCIVNPIGLTDFKIVSEGTRHYLDFGRLDEVGCNDDHYPVGIIVEHVPSNSLDSFLTAYRFDYTAEVSLKNLELVRSEISGEARLKLDILKEITDSSIASNPKDYFNNRVKIKFPSGPLLNTNGDIISLNDQSNEFDLIVSFLDLDNEAIIQNLSAFPVPALADTFFNQNGEPIDERRIAQFDKANYLGLELRFKSGNADKVVSIQNDPLLQIEIEPNSELDFTSDFEVWRFYQNPKIKDEDESFAWQKIDAILENGKVKFSSKLSLGWVICKNSKAACNTPEFPLYAKVTLNIDPSNPFIDIPLNQLYRGVLLADNQLDTLRWAPIKLYNGQFQIFNIPDETTYLNIERKKLEGFESVEQIMLNCGASESITINPTFTKLNVDITEAFCDNRLVAIEKDAEIYAISTMVEPDSPDVNHPRWEYLGFMNDGKFTTYQLEHGKSYWFKVVAPHYGGLSAVFQRPITIETGGIAPIGNTGIDCTNSNGKLCCEPLSNGNYECSFTIDGSIPINELYHSGSRYCRFF